MRYDRRVRAISSILPGIFMLFAATSVAAEEPSIRVAIAPLVYVHQEMLGPLSVEEARAAVLRGSASYVATAGSPFEFASPDAILDRLRADSTYADGVAIGAEWSRLGIAKYRQLDPAGAARDLRQAYEGFLRVGHDFVDPAQVAEVLSFLALALLEHGSEVAGPLDAMKAMIMLRPDVEMKRGAYPDEVVQFFESARLTLERDLRDRGPDPAMVQRFGMLAGLDYVIAAGVLPQTGGSQLVSWLWDVDEQQVVARETIALPSELDTAALEAAANRLASRLLAGLVPPEEVAPTDEIPQSAGDGPFALQLNLAYASYLRFPAVGVESQVQEVDAFGNVGAAIGASFAFTREFAVVAMFQFLNSNSEHSGLVVPGFTTLRWFAGVELGVDVGRVRLALAPTLEAAAVSTISTCPYDAIDRANGRCARETMDLPARLLVGVNARPRVSVRLLDAMDVFVAASGSFFFAPPERTQLNLLTTGEVGLQYRF